MTPKAFRRTLTATALCGLSIVFAGRASAEPFYSPLHPAVPTVQPEATFPYSNPYLHGPTDVYPPGPNPGPPANMQPSRRKRLFNWFGPALFNAQGYKFAKIPGTTVRVDYLLWSGTDPGDQLVGSPLRADGQDPSEIFALASTLTTDDGRFIDAAFGPTLGPVNLNDNNGFRLTASVPTRRHGDFEWSGFILGETTEGFTDLPTEFFPSSVGVFQAAPVLNTTINGVETDAAILFSSNSQVQYEFDVWGTDVTWLLPSQAPRGPGFHLRPTSGFVYRRLQEDMRLRGTASPTTGGLFSTTTLSTAAVDSFTINHIFGPTFGVRAELVHPRFALGVEPAVLLGVNSAKAAVTVENVDGTDRREEVERYFRFSPALELNTYARILLTDKLSLHVGYDLMRFARIFRPANTIRYNVTTAGGGQVFQSGLAADPITGTDFRPVEDADQFTLDGLSVGLEFKPW
ncbi:MAG: BBP7 family outer membrane beta-barrel protein [Planctomycetota bacterium]